MNKKSLIPIAALLGALLIALFAGVFSASPFGERDVAYAQALTDDATLSGLTLTSPAVDLSPTFAATTMKYTARAASGTNKVTVTATPNNASATVAITPSDQDSVTTGHQVLLTGGQNKTITVRVTSEDRTVTETYTVTVYQIRTTPSTDAKLKTLSLKDVTLSPTFASSKTTYAGRAKYETTKTTVSYTTDIGASNVVITPADDDANTDGHQVNFSTAGAVVAVTVVVTAEDTSTTETYTFNVYRENLVKSQNASLATSDGLVLHDGSNNLGQSEGFEYAAGTKSYPNVKVATGIRAVTVTTAVAQAGAVVAVTPSDQDNETTGHQVKLSAGAKTNITVVVTAEDKTTKATYKVTIYRARRVASTDADLSKLDLSGVTLTPTFASGATTYTGRAKYETTKTTVSYTADVGATVAIQDGGGQAVTDADDNADGFQVNLTEGSNTTIAVVVTAEDGTTAKTYTTTVYRENLVKSDDASLAATGGLTLAVTGGSLTGFTYAATTKSYPNVEAPNAVSAVTVGTSTADTGAVAVVTPADQDSVTTGHQVTLAAGAKTDITVVVTAEDGIAKETYKVTIYRNRVTDSTDAKLSALSLSGVTLTPAFASGTVSYSGRAEYDTDKTTVSYTADIGASVAIETLNTEGDAGSGTAVTDADPTADGVQVALTEGANTSFAVVVTAEDATTEEDYIVKVYRENLSKSDNANLAATNGLVISDNGNDLAGADNFTYAATTKSYPNVRVANNVQTVTVKPTAAQPGATVAITPADQDSVSAGHQVILAAGAKTDISVVVTAEDETATETYSVTIYRARRVASTDAKLSALSLSDVVLSPPFSPAKVTYTGQAAYSTQLTTVSYTADVGAQSVQMRNEANDDALADADGSAAGYQVRLTRGSATVFNIRVTAENNTATQDYKVTVYRDNTPSDDATLQSLTLSDVTLMPAFDPMTTAYTGEAKNISMTTVTAMPAHPGATVAGDGEQTLTVGANTITVTVTAEDETVMTYTVVVDVLSNLLEQYDANDNNRIDKAEALKAVDDYLFHGTLTKAEVLEVIELYLFPSG